ncbi:MAG TPA: hypothetical protein VIX37_15145, partial [Candidatus Sulfotelmatobacter sp.]
MASRSSSHSPQVVGTEQWRMTVLQIPTLFGRLVFLASLRDPSGHYYDQDLALALGTEEVNRSLCNSHHQIFQQWLGYSLEEQKYDLDEYLSSGTAPRYALPYRKLVPATA